MWNPAGYDVPITQDLRKFNDRTNSIRIPPGLCVRLHQDHCGGTGRTLENATSESDWVSNLNRKNFDGIISAVELTCKNMLQGQGANPNASSQKYINLKDLIQKYT